MCILFLGGIPEGLNIDYRCKQGVINILTPEARVFVFAQCGTFCTFASVGAWSVDTSMCTLPIIHFTFINVHTLRAAEESGITCSSVAETYLAFV